MRQHDAHHACVAEQRDMAVIQRNRIVEPIVVPHIAKLRQHTVKSFCDRMIAFFELASFEAFDLLERFLNIHSTMRLLSHVDGRHGGKQPRFTVRIRRMCFFSKFIRPRFRDDGKI